MKIIKFHLFIFYSLAFFLANSCVSNELKPSPKEFLGVWRIYKVVDYYNRNSHTYESAKKTIGEKVEFGTDYFICRNDTPFLIKGTYKNVTYSTKLRRYHMVKGEIEREDYDEGTLAGYDLPGAYKDKTVYFIMKTQTGEVYFDVSNKGDLVNCEEKIFIYMRKMNPKNHIK